MPYRLRIVAGLLVFVTGVFIPAVAQDKSKPAAPVSTCSRDSALTIVDRQIDLTRTIDQDAKRVELLLRAADLLWPWEQEKARTTFSEAFEVARRDFKNTGASDTTFGRSIVSGIDYR